MLGVELIVADVAVEEALPREGDAVGDNKTREPLLFPRLRGGEGAELLGERIGPIVLVARADEDEARRDRAEEEVLVEGVGVAFLGVALVVLAEPIGEDAEDVRDELAAIGGAVGA